MAGKDAEAWKPNEGEAKDDVKPSVPKKTAKAAASLSLEFDKSGWCEKLGKSYRQGVYQAKDKKEYDALKPFAKAPKK